MADKSIGIKEETNLLLNRARGVLQEENPNKRYYDDDVVFTALTHFLAGRGKHGKKGENQRRAKSRR